MSPETPTPLAIRKAVLHILSTNTATVRDMASMMQLVGDFSVRSVCRGLRRERMIAYHGSGSHQDKAMQLTAIGKARVAAGRW